MKMWYGFSFFFIAHLKPPPYPLPFPSPQLSISEPRIFCGTTANFSLYMYWDCIILFEKIARAAYHAMVSHRIGKYIWHLVRSTSDQRYIHIIIGITICVCAKSFDCGRLLLAICASWKWIDGVVTVILCAWKLHDILLIVDLTFNWNIASR